MLFLEEWKNLVREPTTNQFREALKFSRFRFTLIEFLKLPFDIGEPALRGVLERTCCGVYRNYLARAERVDEILKSEDTLELNVRVSPDMDHGSDSPTVSQHYRSSESAQETQSQLLAS
jgi:hypothetical protein